MDRALLNRVLAGDQEAIARFGEAEHCAVIDWRDGMTEIVNAVREFLPEGHLQAIVGDDSSCQLLVRGKEPVTVALSPSIKQEELLLRLSEALQPEFELLQFRPSDGDGYSMFVAPRAVWSELKQMHPSASEQLFLSASRLATYWQKGYFARLFSKP